MQRPYTWPYKKCCLVLTGSLELPEVDVGQDEVNDSGAVFVFWPGLKHVTLLQTLTIEHFHVDLRERQLVHARPFLSQQKLLRENIRHSIVLNV